MSHYEPEDEYRSETVGKRPETLYSNVQEPILSALGLADYPITELTLRMEVNRVDIEMKASLTAGPIHAINPLNKQTKS
jgi:hypothetical protein